VISDLQIASCSYTSVSLEWTPPSGVFLPDEDQYGYYISFKRELVDHPYPLILPRKDSEGDLNTGITIDNLIPGCEYIFNIYTFKNYSDDAGQAQIDSEPVSVTVTTSGYTEVSNYDLVITSPTDKSILFANEGRWGVEDNVYGLQASLMENQSELSNYIVYWFTGTMPDNPFTGTLIGISQEDGLAENYLGQFPTPDGTYQIYAVGVGPSGYATDSVTVYAPASLETLDYDTYSQLQFTKRNMRYRGPRQSYEMKATLEEIYTDLNTIYGLESTLEDEMEEYADNISNANSMLINRILNLEAQVAYYEEINNG